MSNRAGWIGGQNERQHDIDRRVDEQRSVDEARAEVAEHRARQAAKVERYAKAQEQLLALSILLYQRARVAELAGQYERVNELHEIAHICRDIRDNVTVDLLSAVGRDE